MRTKKDNLAAVHFEFHIEIIELSPWLRMNNPAVLQWQRGDKKKGLTPPTVPALLNPEGTSAEEPSARLYRLGFNHSVIIPATLYVDLYRGAGKFKGKLLTFSVHEVESEEHPVPKASPLGRAKVDLAEFASLEEEVIVGIPMATSKTVASFLGETKLTIKVYSAKKKLSRSSSKSSVEG